MTTKAKKPPKRAAETRRKIAVSLSSAHRKDAAKITLSSAPWERDEGNQDEASKA